jgi:hypothetical protein
MAQSGFFMLLMIALFKPKAVSAEDDSANS